MNKNFYSNGACRRTNTTCKHKQTTNISIQKNIMLPATHVNTDAEVNKNTNMYLQEITKSVLVIF